jgi:hypothetical protein
MNSGTEVEAFMLKCACSVSLLRKQKVAAHTPYCTLYESSRDPEIKVVGEEKSDP